MRLRRKTKLISSRRCLWTRMSQVEAACAWGGRKCHGFSSALRVITPFGTRAKVRAFRSSVLQLFMGTCRLVPSTAHHRPSRKHKSTHQTHQNPCLSISIPPCPSHDATPNAYSPNALTTSNRPPSQPNPQTAPHAILPLRTPLPLPLQLPLPLSLKRLPTFLWQLIHQLRRNIAETSGARGRVRDQVVRAGEAGVG